MLHHHHTDEHVLAAKADVDSLLQRLSRDISTLDDQGDPANRQALADAGERYETAQVQFGKAESVPELLVARSIVVEGIEATRSVRTRLGPDPAPAPVADAPAEEHHSWAESLARGRGGSTVAAGAAGGVLGLIGGTLLGGALGGDGGDWGGGGDWGE
jgi:hypothetical protein